MEKEFSLEEVIKGRLNAMEMVENRLEKEKSDSINCFTMFIIGMALWNIFVALWADYKVPLTKSQLTIGVEILAGLMFLFVLFRTKLSLKDMGFSFKNIGPIMARAGIICAVCIDLIIIINLIVNNGHLVCHLEKVNPFYLLTAILQEFLARGFLLNCLLKVYTGKSSRVMAITVSSFLFASLHLYYGFTFMLAAGVLSVILGILFLKDRCIWGVSLIHFMLGTAWTVVGFVK